MFWVAAALVAASLVDIQRDGSGSWGWRLELSRTAHAQIRVTSARIGCLDVQKTGNLTPLVAQACDGNLSCRYPAPTPEQYQRAGIQANTRTFCTQAMEIAYQCSDGKRKSVTVPGDAWKHDPAFLLCSSPPKPAPAPSPPRVRPAGPARPGMTITKARIGCLDIQTSGNLTPLVARACDGTLRCSYKAPTEGAYRAAGVDAKTRSFCTQAMEIEYRCPDGRAKSASVPGDAWKHPAARLDCSAPPPPPKGKGIRITKARIGCLDLQRSDNLSELVSRACTGKMYCRYPAPTPDEYQAAGVRASTRPLCTQGMAIEYECGDGQQRHASVDGDAWKNPPAELLCAGPCEALYPAQAQPSARPAGTPALSGWADLHTHPLSHLGFGGKGLHGAPDVGLTMPAGTIGCNERDETATTMAQALGHCNGTHGGWGALDNGCGDHLRAAIINNALDSDFERGKQGVSNVHGDHHHEGYPNLSFWPHHSSVLHQQMWWEWLRRAYEGGLRVMVALTVNSETLAQMLNGNTPFDDASTADRQICATKRFVAQHQDFMEIAYSASDARRIVAENKIAVILGMEVDKIGNFKLQGTSEKAVEREIQRLHQLGVRYALPIHLIDNAFGGSAVYKTLFNLANRNVNGYLYRVTHSDDTRVTFDASVAKGFPGAENATLLGLLGLLKGLGRLPAPCMNNVSCMPPPGKLECCDRFERIVHLLEPSPEFDIYKTIKPGHVNALGLTRLGEVAVTEMMKLKMLVDVDHMSERALRATLALAEARQYPLVMGHNGIRERGGNERGAPDDVVGRIAELGGMMGVGTADATARSFRAAYLRARRYMKEQGALALGSDANGFEPLPHEDPAAKVSSKAFYDDFFQAQSEQKRRLGFGVSSKQRKPRGSAWDYVLEGGVSHYGLMPEFLHDVRRSNQCSAAQRQRPQGCEDAVYDGLMNSAEYFVKMWERIDDAR